MTIEEIEAEWNKLWQEYKQDTDGLPFYCFQWSHFASDYMSKLLAVVKAAKNATDGKRYYGDQAPLMTSIKLALKELEEK